MAKNNNDKRSKAAKQTLAEQADKFRCYQLSVQAPEHETEFFEQAYRDVHPGKKPLALREDFCGTFAVCCQWVKEGKQRTALGVDLCGETLQWGRDHNLAPLKRSQSDRVKILQQDVRQTNRPKADVLSAQNFSFWIFKTREELLHYFRIARSNLKKGGIMVMDMMGGYECYVEEHVDKRTIKKGKNGFQYHWEQRRFDPLSGDAVFSISFRFADGSKLKRAFQYEWRFWSVPEVRELLAEAGFRASHIYMAEEEENGQDTGNWIRTKTAGNDASWLAYIVAEK
ncbi:MAG: class I SAM-dependent methyltransferase [Planctomycetota bacterium]